MKRKLLTLAAAAACAFGGAAQAQISDNTVKIGVLNDMSGLYSDITGPGSLLAARMAVEDYVKATGSRLRIEVVGADHQNKPDVGSNIARQWFDTDKVDMIADVPTSSVGLAVAQIAREKGKLHVNSGSATSDLSGKACNANTIHWAYDTWMLANGTGKAIVRNGGNTWFFLTADYAFGHALARDTEAVVTKTAAAWSARSAHPSPPKTSRLSCCKPKPPKPRSLVWPTPAVTPPTRSSKPPNLASPAVARTWPVCWCSCPMCTLWA